MAGKTASVGQTVFYKWKGYAYPATLVKFIEDAKVKGTAFLNVFTENGVMVVPRAEPGNGDSQYALSRTASVKEEPAE